MNQNVRVAKQLIKLAKELVSFKEDVFNEENKTDIQLEKDINEIEKIIKKRGGYQHVTEEEWMHIFDCCLPFAKSNAALKYNGKLNQQDIENIMQEFRIQALEKVNKNQMSHINNLTRYLFQMIGNITYHYFKKEYLHIDDNVSIDDDEVFKNTPSYDPYEELMKIQRTEKINDFLTVLKATDKQTYDIINKYFFEGKIYEKIAEELGININKVYRIIQKVIMEIKNELEKNYLASKEMKASNSLSYKDIEKILFDKETWKNLN